MARPTGLLLAAGLVPAAVVLAALVWSVARPRRRLWPPKRPTAPFKALAWALTLAVFASATALGSWTGAPWPFRAGCAGAWGCRW